MIATPVKSMKKAAFKQRDAAALSQSMPPLLTQDEDIKALRSHLKNKRSQMPIATSQHSFQATALSQNLDLESLFENESSEDEVLEELFKRKQSLSLDERIARKIKKEWSSTLDEFIASNKEEERLEINTDENGFSSRLRGKPSATPSVETEDLSSDGETPPDSNTSDSLPLLYTDPSSVLSRFDKKLAGVWKASSQSLLIKDKSFRKLASFEQKIQRKLDQDALLGPRRRITHPCMDKMKLRVAEQGAVAKQAGTINSSFDSNENKRLERMQHKHLSSLSKSVNDGRCNTWQCSKCTYLNKSSGSNETCQMCLEPANAIVGLGEDASAPKPPQATKCTRTLTHSDDNEMTYA
jgi:rubrerythrin